MKLNRKSSVALFTLFIVLPFFSQVVKAQSDEDEPKIRVIDVEPVPNEFVSERDIDNFDDNGVLGAGIIIDTDLTGLSIVANNGFVRTPVQEGNTYRMLVSEDERVLTVSADGFFPYEIILNDEGVRLESGKFWRIRITGDRAQNSWPVNFVVSEDEYSLYIDGERTEYTPGQNLLLSEGAHVFRIEKRGFNPLVLDTVVNQNSNFFQVALVPTPRINAEFQTNPDGATISIEGNPLPALTSENEPIKEPLYPGTYEVSITRPGYRVYDTQIRVDENQTQFNFNLQRNAGYVLVRSETPGAQVIIDQKPYEVGEIIELQPRTVDYDVILKSNGYDDYRQSVQVELGDTTYIEENLTLITGDLIVRVQPGDSRIELKKVGNSQPDTVFQGTKSLDDIPVGRYEITASKLNFREETQTFELTRDGLESINFNLTQIDGVGSLTIRSLDGSTVDLRGKQNLTFKNFPAEVETLPFGYYRVKASRKGFKKVNEQIEFRSANQTVDLIQYFEPKTKGGAFTRSLLFPGAGHWYLNRSRGTLYFLGEAALIGLAVVSYGELSTAADDLRIAKEDYQNATTNFDQLFEARQSAVQAQRDAEDQLTLMLTGLAVLKGLELFDILVFTKNPKREYKRLQAQAGAGSLSMRYNF